VVLDIILLFPLIGFAVLGFRDGSARKLVAIAVIILGMFLGHTFMHGIGKFFVEKLNYQPATAPIAAFLTIFLVLFMLQLVLYRFVTGNYKFAQEGGGAIMDKIVAVPLGLVEGVIFTSVLIFLLTMKDGPPRPQTMRESRLYAPVAAVAPQIIDLFSTALPAAQEALENVASPSTTPADSVAPASPGAVDSTLQNDGR